MAQEVDSFFQSFLNFRSRRKVHCSDAQIQHLSCLATPGFIPLGDPRFYPAWRAQHLSRLVNPVFIPLSGPRFYPAWRAQVLSRLVNPVFIPLGEPSVYPAWRAQVLSRLASPGFIPLGVSQPLRFEIGQKRRHQQRIIRRHQVIQRLCARCRHRLHHDLRWLRGTGSIAVLHEIGAL